MVVRRRRKKNKLRGHRTHGAGGTKNRRGAGTRGGVGRAGSHKHKFSKYYLTFGIKRKLKAKKKGKAINLIDISRKLDAWVESGKAAGENGVIVLDGKKLGFAKILSVGNVKEKIKIVNAKVSAKAAEKIAEAGGEAGSAKEKEEGFGEEEESGEEE